MSARCCRSLVIAFTALAVDLATSGTRAEVPDTGGLAAKYPEVNQTTRGGPLWEMDLGKTAFVVWSLGGGYVLVAGDSIGCALLESNSGTELWSRPGLKGTSTIYWIDIGDSSRGCIAYNLPRASKDKGKSGGSENSGLTLEMISLIDGFPAWSSDQFDHPFIRSASYLSSINALWLWGLTPELKWWSAVVSLDGEVLWQKVDLVEYDKGDLLFGFPRDTLRNNRVSGEIDSSAAMLLQLTKKSIRNINLLTGEVLWSVAPKGWKIPDYDKRYARVVFDAARKQAFIPQKNSILAINYETGASTWAAQPVLKGHPYQMAIVDQGLLVLGGVDPEREGDNDFITLLDPVDGKLVWTKSFAKLDHQFTSNFVIYRRHAWVYSKKKFWCIDLVDGSSQKLIDSLKFSSNEPTPFLELGDGVFHLTGFNSMACMEEDGSLRFLTKYNPPPAHWGIGDILTAAWVVAQVASTASSAGSPGYRPISFPSRLPKGGNPEATSLENQYVYILTNVRDSLDRKPGIAKVNRLTGKVEAAIQLDDRKPEYVSDEAYRRLYYLRDGHTLECYEF